MEVRIINVEWSQLKQLLTEVVREQLAGIEGRIQTGDELGRVSGIELAEEITGLKRSTIKSKSARRYDSDGIPCIVGPDGRYSYSSVALNRWKIDGDSRRWTLWMEGIIVQP